MSEKRRSLGSDLAKIDAHVISQDEYDEIPELTEDDFSRGVLKVGDPVVGLDEFREAVRKAVGGAGRSVGKTGRSIGLGKLIIHKLGLKSAGKIGSVGKVGLKSASKKSQRQKSKPRKAAPKRKRA
jgi:hypothetical protein